LDEWRIEFQFAGGADMFVPYHRNQTISGIPQPPVQWALGGYFSKQEYLGSDANHSPPSHIKS